MKIKKQDLTGIIMMSIGSFLGILSVKSNYFIGLVVSVVLVIGGSSILKKDKDKDKDESEKK